jgi:hypothetical protein
MAADRHAQFGGTAKLNAVHLSSQTADRVLFRFAPRSVRPQLAISISGMRLFSSRFVEMYFSQEPVAPMAHFGTIVFLSTAYLRTNCGLS